MRIRRICIAAALAVAAGAGHAAGAIDEVLEASLKDKKGVLVYVNGQAIGGRVTKLSADAVELTGREYGRIVLRRERIDGVAGN